MKRIAKCSILTMLLVTLLIVSSALNAETPIADQPDSVPAIWDRPLYLHITSLKQTYFENESIQLIYWMENRSADTQFYRDDEIDRLVILDPSGSKVQGCNLCIQPMPVMKLNPRDSSLSFTDWKKIAPWGTVGRYPSDLLYGQVWVKRFKCGSIPSGTFTIMGDRIKSDTISIDIVDPAGTAESEASQQFKLAMDFGAEHGGVTRQGHFGMLEDFLKRFPNSVYVPRALGELLAGDSTQAARTAELLVSEFPEYSYAGEAIWKVNLTSVSADSHGKLARGLKRIREEFSEVSSVVNRTNELITTIEREKK